MAKSRKFFVLTPRLFRSGIKYKPVRISRRKFERLARNRPTSSPARGIKVVQGRFLSIPPA